MSETFPVKYKDEGQAPGMVTYSAQSDSVEERVVALVFYNINNYLS